MGRARADALDGYEALYVHIKGPDVPAHDGRAEDKRDVIDAIDRAFFGEVLPAARPRPHRGRRCRPITPPRASARRTPPTRCRSCSRAAPFTSDGTPAYGERACARRLAGGASAASTCSPLVRELAALTCNPAGRMAYVHCVVRGRVLPYTSPRSRRGATDSVSQVQHDRSPAVWTSRTGGERSASASKGAPPGSSSGRASSATRSPCVAGLVVILLIVLALLAPLFSQFVVAPTARTTSTRTSPTSSASRSSAPARRYWFGVDELGRDVFVRSLYGARTSLMVALLGTGISLVIGIVLGLIAGFRGGKIDTFISRADRHRPVAAAPAARDRHRGRVRRQRRRLPRRHHQAGRRARHVHHRPVRLAVRRAHRSRPDAVPAGTGVRRGRAGDRLRHLHIMFREILPEHGRLDHRGARRC